MGRATEYLYDTGHEDIRFWLTRCQAYFDRNKLQWREASDRIKYALGKCKARHSLPLLWHTETK